MPRPFGRLFRLAAREPSVGDDVSEEIATHLEELTDWYCRQGLTPEAARERAQARFGDVERFRREIGSIDHQAGRFRRAADRLQTVRTDLVVALRGLRRSPGYATVVVATLGIALGANATMFGVIDRLLLQPPTGVGAPDEVRRVQAARWIDERLSEPWDALSYPSFLALRDRATRFRQVAAVTEATVSLGSGAEARPARSVFATGDYFALLQARPSQGRLFGPDDDQPPVGNAVAVVSERFWRTALGRDPAVIGRTIQLNHQPFQIIGVGESGFNGTGLEPIDLWVPFQSVGPLVQGATGDATWRTGRGWQWLNVLVRLAPGVGDQVAADDATAAYRGANLDFAPFEAKAVLSFRSLAAYSESAGPERVAGWLYGVTLAVLLIACANIANVVLARGFGRRGEIAVRKALGISRARLTQQFLTETVILIGAGLVVGLLVAHWGGLLVRQLLLAGTVWDRNPIDLRVLAATAVAAALAAGLASWWPLARSARVDPATELHGAGRATARGGSRARRGLLLVQTTLSTALVVLAGLFVKSIGTIRSLDLGIRPDDAYLVSIDLEGMNLGPVRSRQLFDWATERIRQVPGVVAAGITFGAPFKSNMGGSIVVPGHDSLPRLEGGGPYFFRIGPGTLAALGARVVAGRDVAPSDRRGTAPVALVSERMAATIWPGESALGKCFYPGRSIDSLPCLEVVGIVADLHRQSLDEAPFFLYFTAFDQGDSTLVPHHVVVRTAPGQPNPAESIRKTLLAERSDLPYVPVQSYREVLSSQARQWELGASLLTVFGLLSLGIAAIGLYGVIAFGVSQQTREIGLRSALGASPGRLLWGTIAGGLFTAALGAGLGLVLSLIASGRIDGLLFRTRATDPLVLGAAAIVVGMVSLVAAWIPGRRALAVDPMGALRGE